jgi:hypothetical protein
MSLLFAIILAVYALRLTYLQRNPKVRTSLLRKHKKEKGEQAHKMYSQVYSHEFYILWLIFTGGWLLNLIVGTIADIFDWPALAIVQLVVLIGSAIITLDMWYKIFGKNSSRS